MPRTRQTTVTIGRQPAPTANTTPHLPFEMPSRAVLMAGREVWMHPITTYPPSVQNEASRPDYWDRVWMPGGSQLTAEDAAWNGDVRERKPFFPARAGSDWHEQNLAIEWRWCRDAGFNGVTPDMVNRQPDTHWDRFMYMLGGLAILGDPTFQMWPWFDGQTTITGKAPETGAQSGVILANDMFDVRNHPNIARDPDTGEYRWVAYHPSAAPHIIGPANGGDPVQCHNFWASLSAEYTRLGMPSQILYMHQSSWTGSLGASFFDDIPGSWGHSRFGDRTPSQVIGNTDNNFQAANYCHMNFPGRKWYHPVSFSDQRPHNALYVEQGGSGVLRGSYQTARNNNSDGAIFLTWDDHAEGSALVPNETDGPTWLELAAYENAWYKTMVRPTTVRPTTYIIARKHSITLTTFTTPNPPYTTLMQWWNGKSDAAQNNIEAYVFPTQDCEVRIMRNGTVIKTQAVTAAAGPTQVYTPFVEGTISCGLYVGGVLVPNTLATTPTNFCSNTQPVQNTHYYAFSSRASLRPAGWGTVT